MLVGLAIALFMAASASSLLVNNLREDRALMMESRLNQDLQRAQEVIFRELRQSAATAGAVSERFALHRGIIEHRDEKGAWHPVSDPQSLTVTALQLTLTVRSLALDEVCAVPCPAGSSPCPPHQEVRQANLVISAQPAGDATVQRTSRASVRLRNDVVVGECPG